MITAQITVVALSAVMVRQLFVLASVVRSVRFLATTGPPPPGGVTGCPTFFVVVPVLRENAVIVQTIEHLQASPVSTSPSSSW